MTEPTYVGIASGQRTARIDYGEFTEEEVDELIADLPGGQGVSTPTRRLLQQLMDVRRQLKESAQVVHQPLDPSPDPDADLVLPLPQLVRQPPPYQPCRMFVIRKVDVTGISGLGHIAEGFQASDGAVVWRWLKGPPKNRAKWEFYDDKGVDPFEEISGHNGNTEVIWLDPREEGWRP
jgi:hypothetical protein